MTLTTDLYLSLEEAAIHFKNYIINIRVGKCNDRSISKSGRELFITTSSRTRNAPIAMDSWPRLVSWRN